MHLDIAIRFPFGEKAPSPAQAECGTPRTRPVRSIVANPCRVVISSRRESGAHVAQDAFTRSLRRLTPSGRTTYRSCFRFSKRTNAIQRPFGDQAFA